MPRKTPQADDQTASRAERCDGCLDGVAPPFPFTMAFQPVVDVSAGAVYAYEALVRGPAGEGAARVLGQITPANRYAFDQSCRVKAITLASRLGLGERGACLSINFLPGAMYRPETCVRTTLAAARRTGFPLDRLERDFLRLIRAGDSGAANDLIQDAGWKTEASVDGCSLFVGFA